MTPARPLDAEALAAIHAAGFSSDEAWPAASIGRLLAQPGVFGRIEAQGGMILARVAADEAEILTLAVLPEARRRGIGRALLEAACDQAAGLGAEMMFLEVSGANRAALALYLAGGFELAGARPRYYPDGADAMLMRRRLAAPCA